MAERRIINGVLYEKGADGAIRRVDAPAGQPSIQAIPLPRAPTDVAKEGRDVAAGNRDEIRTGIAVRGEGRDVANQAFDKADKFRDEYRASPGVVEYNVALGTFNSALNTKPSAQGDQSLITSYAKMLDPTSVVREGEFAVTAATEATVNQIKARLAKEFGWQDGGMLTPAGREAIRGEMRNLVVNRFQPAYERDRAQYTKFAELSGLDPYLIVGEEAAAQFPKGMLAAPGSQTKMGDLPPAYQQAYDAFIKAGNFTPEQYATFRRGLDLAFFPNSEDQTALYTREGAQIIENGGVPGGGGVIPGVEQPMGAFEGAANTALQNPAGTFAADAVNASLGGLPARLSGNQDDLEALRAMNPKAAFAGQVAGGIGGAIGAGKVLGLASEVAPLGARTALANPLVADAGYGAIYGSTQDDNPFRGAVIGGVSALGGAAAGQALGKAVPGLFNRSGVQAADNSVPTGDQLRRLAGEQYRAVEAAGEVAGENATQELADSTQQLLAGQGRVTPRGNLIDTNNSIARANQLIQDFAGAPMTPTQAQSVRGVLGDGLTAMDNGAPDNTQRRLAGMMIDNFDEWADPVLPNIAKPRETASRYLQGDQIARAREIADANEQWFTQSGPDNSIRNSFRNLDRDAVRGKSRMPERVTDAIETVSRGTPLANAARMVGKLAPTGALPITAAASLGGMTAAGGAPMAGGLLTGAIMGAGMAGRAVANQRTRRAAEIAELLARGGPEYEAALAEAAKGAIRRGGLFGTGLGVAGGSAISR